MDFKIEEIDERMKRDGFPELCRLWESFKALGRPLEQIDDAALAASRERHMDWLARPLLMLLLAAAAALTARSMLAGLAVYAVWFIASWAARQWLLPWKSIAVLDLAAMLKRRSYREWLDSTTSGREVMSRLAGLGVNGFWDDPNYRIWLKSSADGIESVEFGGTAEAVQRALREILGAKVDSHFRPGRYIESLKDRKESVTRLVQARAKELAASREGLLSAGEGIALLDSIRRTEIRAGSAGDKYLEQAVSALSAPEYITPGVVEAAIWRRDPWSDLTRAEDFFSSASLRGDSLRDALERRAKGIMGPFGYMRNKSISAMDFKTSAGRGARARLAAAIASGSDGSRSAVLFVDAVEGRFDIKPALIRKALEDYARAAGFSAVLYHAFPLNTVPRRFVSALAAAGARLEECQMEYADAEQREYLDAFGLPLEPFEYACPKGKVIGYRVDVGEPTARERVAPSRTRLVWSMARGKALLWALVIVSCACLASALERVDQDWLPWAAVLAAVAAAYKMALGRQAPPSTEPGFVSRIIEDISRDPIAVKMSYPGRLGAKAVKLLEFFDNPSRELAPFFEAVLANVSMKDSHIENALKFMRQMTAAQRRGVAELAALLWPASDPETFKIGLSEDKPGRDAALAALTARIDSLRSFVKAAPVSAWAARSLRLAARALRLSPEKILELASVRPKILRGLWKYPRPLYAWLAPTAAALVLAQIMANWVPDLPAWAGVLPALAAVLGTWIMSTQLAVAPGILWYEKTRRRLGEAREGRWKHSPVCSFMSALGINVSEYLKGTVRESSGVRVEIRDKRERQGALEFLTSSEEIGNCIALRHFVSWTLPSLLDDETVLLADVSLPGSSRSWQRRAQIWMVAAQRRGEPVLTLNSVEFNEEGARNLELIMPAVIETLRDVALRAGFKAIYAGISDFGRDWLDARYPQAAAQEPILKAHHPGLGYDYYFDAFQHKRWGGRRYEYAAKRSPAARLYALVFGALEYLKGNRAKAASYFDSVANANNLWEIPVSERSSDAHAAQNARDVSETEYAGAEHRSAGCGQRGGEGEGFFRRPIL